MASKGNKKQQKKNSSNVKILNTSNTKIDDDLDWINEMQNDLDKSKSNINVNNKSKVDKKNKNKKAINNNSVIENKILICDNKTNDESSKASDDESSKASDDVSVDKLVKQPKIKQISNRFGFISSDESDNESDNESVKESVKESVNESDNKFDDKLDKQYIITNSHIEYNIKKLNSSVDLNYISNEILVTQEIQNEQNKEYTQNDQNYKKKINKKEKKGIISQINKESNLQYKFDINTNIKKMSNISNISNTLNSLTTLYSDDLEVIVGGKTLISTSNITINSGQKYFVLGQNGIGKTSLLKQIYSNLNDNSDILMLDQDIQLESTTQTIQEFILGADRTLYESKKRMDQLEMLDEMDDIESVEYENLSEIIMGKEWDKYESESKRIINGLGFNNPNLSVSILSGGKRMILAIGKALLRKPEILILDEPTNHLDLDVVIWLTNYLEGYKKTLIIITHQIGLVNSLADVIWYIGNPELTGNKVYTIRGHYDKLIQFLEDKDKETNKNYDKFNKKVEEMRKKSTPKKDVEEFIKKNGVPRPPKPYNVNITFDNVVELSTRNIIEFREVNFGYSDCIPIYKNLNITLGMGSRIVLVGPNGCGKTTFFKLASSDISPTDGYILSDERLRVGYYNQQIIDHLPLELNSIEYLQSLNTKLSTSECRSILGKLGIKKQDNLDLPTNKIGDLSGGQKARVSFGSVQMSNPHLILLDEPTNHLDLESIEGLIKGINEFNGGIVIITHDMYLIESITNADIYQVTSSNIVKFMGDFEEYCKYITKL